MVIKARTLIVVTALAVSALPAGQVVAGPELRNSLMQAFDTMNAKHAGIFHEDVTAIVQPFFPVGQPIAQTRRIVAEQKLGALKPFMGTNDPGMGTMYVAKFALTGEMFAHVYVVLDFDFDGAAPDMTLKAMKAYLRTSNM